MRDDDETERPLRAQAEEHGHELGAGFVVEAGQRFVEHEQRTLAHEQPRQRDPALLTAAQIVDGARRELRWEPDELQRIVHRTGAGPDAVELAGDRAPQELQARVLKAETDPPHLRSNRMVLEARLALGRCEQSGQ